jgi:hypothetical protein
MARLEDLTPGARVTDAWHGEAWHGEPHQAWRGTLRSGKVGTSSHGWLVSNLPSCGGFLLPTVVPLL